MVVGDDVVWLRWTSINHEYFWVFIIIIIFELNVLGDIKLEFIILHNKMINIFKKFK